MFKLCKGCHKEFDAKSKGRERVFCSPECRKGYFNHANDQKGNYPEYICKKGHLTKLDFFPLKNLMKWHAFKCPMCKPK